MNVGEICTRSVVTCTPQTTLTVAGWSMWEHDCGILPVINEQGKVTGAITDRDICMAVATNSRPAHQITVGEITAKEIYSCKPDDDVRVALFSMQKNQVRRLPVIDTDGKLRGILSVNDAILAARPQREANIYDLKFDDIGATLSAICQHRVLATEVSKPQEQIAGGGGN